MTPRADRKGSKTMKTQKILQLLALTFSRWNGHDAPRLGAALAYYTLLSVAPLLIIAIMICGVVFGQGSTERQVLDQARSLVGSEGADAIHLLMKSASHRGAGVIATVIAVAALLFGASGVLVELQDSMNTIWDATPKTAATWRGIIWQRVVAFGMVLGIGLLLLISLLCSAAIQVIEKFFAGFVPVSPQILEAANVVFSLLAISVLFALIFKYVPNASIIWWDVGIGAVVTAVLFTIGKFLLAWYLGTAGIASAYGAAGSIVALVVWVYYSAQIFLFGAIFTRVYALNYGSHASAAPGKQPAVRVAQAG
jgi:membrane protein